MVAYFDALVEYALISLEAADNPLLQEILMDFVPSTMRVMYATMDMHTNNSAKKTIKYFQTINNCIKTRDTATAVSAVREYFSNERELALRALRKSQPQSQSRIIKRK